SRFKYSWSPDGSGANGNCSTVPSIARCRNDPAARSNDTPSTVILVGVLESLRSVTSGFPLACNVTSVVQIGDAELDELREDAPHSPGRYTAKLPSEWCTK